MPFHIFNDQSYSANQVMYWGRIFQNYNALRLIRYEDFLWFVTVRTWEELFALSNNPGVMRLYEVKPIIYKNSHPHSEKIYYHCIMLLGVRAP